MLATISGVFLFVLILHIPTLLQKLSPICDPEDAGGNCRFGGTQAWRGKSEKGSHRLSLTLRREVPKAEDARQVEKVRGRS